MELSVFFFQKIDLYVLLLAFLTFSNSYLPSVDSSINLSAALNGIGLWCDMLSLVSVYFLADESRGAAFSPNAGVYDSFSTLWGLF